MLRRMISGAKVRSERSHQSWAPIESTYCQNTNTSDGDGEATTGKPGRPFSTAAFQDTHATQPSHLQLRRSRTPAPTTGSNTVDFMQRHIDI
jgi:hypothetical protein